MTGNVLELTMAKWLIHMIQFNHKVQFDSFNHESVTNCVNKKLFVISLWLNHKSAACLYSVVFCVSSDIQAKVGIPVSLEFNAGYHINIQTD